MKVLLLVTSILFGGFTLVFSGEEDGLTRKVAKAKKRPHPAFAPVGDEPGLPRVLLIGDSISIGYTLDVRSLLREEANVHRPPANCQSTREGLVRLEGWLGERKWDVIHFNWGLHDLKYIGEDGEIVAVAGEPGSKQKVPLDTYRKNLTKLVNMLEDTGAKLIWRSTTPIPVGAKGRISGDEVHYNAAARTIMTEKGIPVHDLYAFALPKLAKIQREADVHYSRDGSKALASDVARVIRQALGQ